MKKFILLVLALVLATASSFAQSPQLVKDIYPGANPSATINYTNVNGTLFLSADDGVYGTESGTQLTLDIAPGSGSSNPTFLEIMGNSVFFGAASPGIGVELWTSDGSAAGTSLVKDINPGPNNSHSYPSYLTHIDGTIFFSADDGTHGDELWSVPNIASAVEEPRQSQVFHLFPNPAHDQATIQCRQPYTGPVALYDSMGRLIWTKNISHQKEFSLNLNGLNDGLYWVRLHNPHALGPKLIISKN